MDQSALKKALTRLSLGTIRYFDTIGSTNDEALAWAANDMPDLSLIVADEQTAGRGRLDRKWFTPRGTALAFSLLLRPTAEEKPHLTRIVGLAALAVAETLRARGLEAQIKWPNDVLIHGKKVGGILTEAVWSGDEIDCVVIGIGLNVHREAVPPTDVLLFPATSLEDELGSAPERLDIVQEVLSRLLEMRPQLPTDELIARWQSFLAFQGEAVQVETGDMPAITGTVDGLEADGSLRVRNERGETITVRFGDVRLRPLA